MILFGGSKENDRKLRFLQVFGKKCRFYDYDALVLLNIICYSFLLFTQKLVASRVTFSTCVWLTHNELQLLEVLDCFWRGNAQEASLQLDEKQQEKLNARGNSHPWPNVTAFSHICLFFPRIKMSASMHMSAFEVKEMNKKKLEVIERYKFPFFSQ